MEKLGKWRSLIIVGMMALVSGCTKISYVEDSQFEGEWELKGRAFLNGMRVKIERDGNALIGKVTQKPTDNRYADIFMQEGDKWVKSISRISNYSFRLKESRIAAPLFSSYGISSTEEYRVEFFSENRFGMTQGSGSPKNAPIYYERVPNTE